MSWSTRVQLFKGSMILLVGFGGFAAWSLLTEIDGAVVAPGQVGVEARRQVIQHPDGGLVTAVHVREGTSVVTGAPILTLDGAEVSAQLALLTRDMVETLARLDRLRSEVLGLDTVNYRSDLHDASFPEILEDETALFQARRATLQQTEAQLLEQQAQTGASIAGQQRQLDATQEQRALILQELATQQELQSRGLTQASAVLALQREAARLNGAVGELEAGIAQSNSAIAGLEIEILRQRAAFREAAHEEMRALQPRESELREQLRVTQTRFDRLVLRAPMAGTVLGLSVHTVGGVIAPGAEVAGIIPGDAPLILTVEIDPGQIDRIHIGQPARLRFPSFNALTTPEVNGHVTTVSADALADPATGRRFYVAELALAEGATEALGHVTLQPGMPVEALIQTDSRTPASFLLKPLADYWAYAFREE